MRFLSQLFNFYIDSSIHVAFAVFSLTYITLIDLGMQYNEPVLYFVFYASITGYNFVKYFGIAKFHHRQLANWLKVIQILSFVCFLAMAYYAIQLQTKTLVYLLFFAVLTFLYAIPFLVNKRLSLRTISGIKVLVIALVWTGVTVFIPIIEQDEMISSEVAIISLQRFVYVLILMLPFEIRDLKYDNKNLYTIPQKLGVKKTKVLGMLLLIVFIILELLKTNSASNVYWSTLIIASITAFFLLEAKEDQSKFYSSFLVESLPILWLVIILLLN